MVISTGQSGALKVGGSVPLFVLPSLGGGTSGPGSLKSRYNMVLLFLQDSPDARAYLRALASMYPDILFEQARALAIISLPQGGAMPIVGTDLPFPLLVDKGGATTRRMLGEGSLNALCVADRFGEVFCLETAPTPAELPETQTALDWLLFVQIQCPE